MHSCVQQVQVNVLISLPAEGRLEDWDGFDQEANPVMHPEEFRVLAVSLVYVESLLENSFWESQFLLYHTKHIYLE